MVLDGDSRVLKLCGRQQTDWAELAAILVFRAPR
jgi:hypothetical protein